MNTHDLKPWRRGLIGAILIAGLAGCAVPEAGGAPEFDGPLHVASVYAPHGFDLSTNPQFYALSIDAADDADFRRKLAAARAAGPGRPVPAGVVVDGWLELDGLSRLRSSVTGDFQSFRLEIGGAVVADLAEGRNALVVEAGNGWTTLVVALPPGLVLPGTPTRLVQRRRGADRDLLASLDF